VVSSTTIGLAVGGVCVVAAPAVATFVATYGLTLVIVGTGLAVAAVTQKPEPPLTWDQKQAKRLVETLDEIDFHIRNQR